MELAAERELIQRCLTGADDAWDELFQEHYAAVGRYIFQLSNTFTREDCDEICQEVFLSVVKNLKNFGGKSRFRLAINALPIKVGEVSPQDPLLGPETNPPILGFTVLGEAAKRLSQLACYASDQGIARLERLGSRVEVRLDAALPPGRTRINCTMLTRSGRWRWYGLQFYVPRG